MLRRIGLKGAGGSVPGGQVVTAELLFQSGSGTELVGAQRRFPRRPCSQQEKLYCFWAVRSSWVDINSCCVGDGTEQADRAIAALGSLVFLWFTCWRSGILGIPVACMEEGWEFNNTCKML